MTPDTATDRRGATTRTKTLLVIAFLVTAGGAAWFQIDGQIGTTQPTTSSSLDVKTAPAISTADEDLNGLAARVAQLRSQVETQDKQMARQDKTLQRTLAKLRQRQHQADHLSTPDAVDPDIDPFSDPDLAQAEQARAAEEAFLAQLDLLDQTLRNETTNPDWSLEVTEQMDEAFGQDSEHYLLQSVDCAETICRVEANIAMVGDDPSQTRGLDHVIHGDAGWTGPSTFAWNTETGQATIYLLRDGAQMPEADAAY